MLRTTCFFMLALLVVLIVGARSAEAYPTIDTSSKQALVASIATMRESLRPAERRQLDATLAELGINDATINRAYLNTLASIKYKQDRIDSLNGATLSELKLIAAIRRMYENKREAQRNERQKKAFINAACTAFKNHKERQFLISKMHLHVIKLKVEYQSEFEGSIPLDITLSVTNPSKYPLRGISAILTDETNGFKYNFIKIDTSGPGLIGSHHKGVVSGSTWIKKKSEGHLKVKLDSASFGETGFSAIGSFVSSYLGDPPLKGIILTPTTDSAWLTSFLKDNPSAKGVVDLPKIKASCK